MKFKFTRYQRPSLYFFYDYYSDDKKQFKLPRNNELSILPHLSSLCSPRRIGAAERHPYDLSLQPFGETSTGRKK